LKNTSSGRGNKAMQKIDVVIIGAGQAGLAEAIQLRAYGQSVTVAHEFPKRDGRMLGQLHQAPRGEWWNGIKDTRLPMEQAKQDDTHIECGVAGYHIEKLDESYVIYTKKQRIHATNVLIATGAAEVQAPLPGWTLPGVMSIGAAQVMTNVHRVSVGDK